MCKGYYDNMYMIINRMARRSNKIKCWPKTILVIQLIISSAIKISMITRNSMSNLWFLVMAAAKYAISIRAATIIINISNNFIPSPLLYYNIKHLFAPYLFLHRSWSVFWCKHTEIQFMWENDVDKQGKLRKIRSLWNGVHLTVVWICATVIGVFADL